MLIMGLLYLRTQLCSKLRGVLYLFGTEYDLILQTADIYSTAQK